MHFRVLTPLALLAALSACSVAPRTPMQGSFDAISSYAVVAKAANAYLAMPRCSATVHQPCSDQAVAERIKAADNVAYDDVMATEKVAGGAGVTSTDEEKANAAMAAITTLQRSIPTRKE